MRRNATIELTLTGGELTLKGAKPRLESVEGAVWHLQEATFGEFERTFTFPTAVANDSVRAESAHGVLTITVEKAPEAIRRTIPINVK